MPGRVKYCSHCKVEHPVSEFGRNRQSPDGLHYFCRMAAAARQRAWAKANPDKIRTARAAYISKLHALNARRDPYE